MNEVTLLTRNRCGIVAIAMAMSSVTTAHSAETPCEAGAYGSSDQNIVVLTPKDWVAPPGLGYLMLDGRYGSTQSPTSPTACGVGSVVLKDEHVRLERKEFKRTREEIRVAGAVLVGELLASNPRCRT